MKDIQEIRRLIFGIIAQANQDGLYDCKMSQSTIADKVKEIMELCGIVYIPKDQEIDSNVRNRN